MHWFRANHNNCPLCQNQGINYNEAYKLANESNFHERRCWQQYYKKAASYSRKKNANTEIIKKIKSIQKIIEKDKQSKKDFSEWKKAKCNDSLTNLDIFKIYTKKRQQKWRYHRTIYQKKVTIGYLYYHTFMKNKLIIAEKVSI